MCRGALSSVFLASVFVDDIVSGVEIDLEVEVDAVADHKIIVDGPELPEDVMEILGSRTQIRGRDRVPLPVLR